MSEFQHVNKWKTHRFVEIAKVLDYPYNTVRDTVNVIETRLAVKLRRPLD